MFYHLFSATDARLGCSLVNVLMLPRRWCRVQLRAPAPALHASAGEQPASDQPTPARLRTAACSGNTTVVLLEGTCAALDALAASQTLPDP